MKTFRFTLLKKSEQGGSQFGRSFVVPVKKQGVVNGFPFFEFTLRGKVERLVMVGKSCVFQKREWDLALFEEA